MQNLQLSNQKVLVRVDFNVPLDSSRQVTDDTRIQAAVPTIEHLLEQDAAVILMSHLGRPQQKKKEDGSIDREKLTLRHVVPALEKALGRKVKFASDTTGTEARKMAEQLQPGEVLLLENTRFEPGEEKGDRELARQMADLADFYINDAFGTAHRAHASTTVVADFFDQQHKAFGYLMQREVDNASRMLDNPGRPVTAIIGGAKVSDKIQLLERMLDFANNILIGGAMAYTFFKARGGQVGNSLIEEDKLGMARDLLQKAASKSVNLLLPADSVVAKAFDNEAEHKTTPSDAIPDGWMGLDIGEKAREDFARVINDSRTIFWNGPMGVFEMSNYAGGTNAVAHAVAEATRDRDAYSLIGGGDSVSAINQAGLADEVSFVSTGGGAMLEFLEGKQLPGIRAIKG